MRDLSHDFYPYAKMRRKRQSDKRRGVWRAIKSPWLRDEMISFAKTYRPGDDPGEFVDYLIDIVYTAMNDEVPRK